ncbi:HEPN domain-containing protein [Cobetia sp. SIMBA_158]|uniref:HEPN domain-containing protein n=1 Tax=Cobetia sp. SIMBA_158 TaxID=3081617 RepID=UPI00397F25ED
MAYSKSTSRKSFEEKVDHLLRTARLASLKRANNSASVIELVMHAAIFETSAALEEYIKDFFEHYEFVLHRNECLISNLPQNTIAFLYLKANKVSSSLYIEKRDERKAIEKVCIDENSLKLLNANQIFTRGLGLKNIISDKKYPTPKNWKLLFNRFGINDFHVKVDPILKGSSRNIMDSFNDIRTAIAHENPPALTFLDISKHLDNIVKLVSALDRMLHTHVCSHSGKPSWPNRQMLSFSA